MLEVLANRKSFGAAAQQTLLRALVGEAQAQPEVRLWRQALLCAFLPMLARIRAGTIAGDHHPDDLDSALRTAFLEVVHAFPLRRQGSISTSLWFDTRRRFFQRLRIVQEARREARSLIAYAELLVEPDKPETYNFSPFDHCQPTLDQPPDAEELREMRAVLDRIDDISRDDADLVFSTSVEQQSIREFMDHRGLSTGIAQLDDQLRERIKKRRQRALARLGPALRRIVGPKCPHER